MSEKMEQDLKHILDNVNFIRKKYDDIAKITGENFNIFKIFGKEYHENYHSAIISDLLNEKGCHGQGRLFLDLFIPFVNKKIIEKRSNNPEIDLKEITDFTDSTSVTEKVIDDYDRIDIYLSSKNQTIIIENKICAPFQHRQLKRYFDYASKGNDFVILYLWTDLVTFNEDVFYQDPWPFGKPEEKPIEVKAKTISISYREDIKNWIELSIKECSSLPLIRETLIQYLNTINIITEQSTNNKMSIEIIDEILITNKIKEALLIGDNIKELKFKIMAHFAELLIKMANENSFLYYFNDTRFGENESEMIFKKVGYKYSVCLGVYDNFKLVNIGIIDQNGNWYKGMVSNFSEWSKTSLSDIYKGVLVDAVKYELESNFQKIENIKE
jgi:hypothetical protein